MTKNYLTNQIRKVDRFMLGDKNQNLCKINLSINERESDKQERKKTILFDCRISENKTKKLSQWQGKLLQIYKISHSNFDISSNTKSQI